MSIYDSRYYYLNKFTLSVIGQWPYQTRLEGNTMFGITLFMFGSLTALETMGLIKGITNISIFMENMSPLLVNVTLFGKLINFYFQKSKIRELLNYIEQHWKMMSSGRQNEILRSYAEQSKVWFIRYAMAIYLMGHLYCLMPYVVSGIYSFLSNVTYSAKFLYRLEHVFDVDKYFHLLVFHLYISLMFMLTVAVAIDSMFLICIQHVCALFDIIRYNIEHIQNTEVIILKPNVLYDEPYHVIIDCIKIYNRAYEFSKLLSSSFEISYFFLLGNTITCLSFSMAEVNMRQIEKIETLVFSFHLLKYLLFKLIMVDVQLDEIIRIIAANVAQLVHIYYLSFISQRLIDYSSKLHEVIYSCNWYTTSKQSRQLLLFTLLRFMKPCQIKAGKIYVLSMENFSSIIQVSLSYFTMLTSLQ
ncbi:odorant receptor 13a-like isoform X1 [Odontomachus brunneus]|uniref:odorant receptor 13a-like isoform X1 n=1 Tax=Odontomachus brunneus TaxID=486640 RepID=UPI0013F197E1|nr:odorant receptor 13a-like isoform X1 [Odontomachus brunneus]